MKIQMKNLRRNNYTYHFENCCRARLSASTMAFAFAEALGVLGAFLLCKSLIFFCGSFRFREEVGFNSPEETSEDVFFLLTEADSTTLSSIFVSSMLFNYTSLLDLDKDLNK